ncbi:MAG: hypothetical protein ACR2H9_12170 [Longimicrobiaceae bacterium]
MGELYQGESGGVELPRDEQSAGVQANQAAGPLTIEDAIRLTARFDEEWFRSFETLDADLTRFAAAFHLSPEDARQVRKVVETLHEGEDGRRNQQEGSPAGTRSYVSPERNATAA